jgi:formylglycine-generating enzyme required for sulfatase activity
MKRREKNTVLGGIFTVLAIFGLVFTACGDGSTPGSGPTADPADPVISTQLLETATYDLNAEPETVSPLTVTATASDDGVLSYQWYKNTANSNEGGTAIEGATEASFTPPTDKKGVVYYYVIVTNTLNGKTANATSNPAGIGVGITTVKITSGLTVESKVYDGTTTATVNGTAVLSGVEDGDVVTVIAGTVAFNDKNVGTNKAITFSGWSLGGAGAGNYMLSAQHEDIKGEITAKDVTITGLAAANKEYDGTTTATVNGTAVINGIIDGDTVTVVTGTATFADANIGNGKTVTFSGWSLTGTDSGNYSLEGQPANATADITLGVEMVQIPATVEPFMMGSPTDETNRSTDETPHPVILSGFYMGKYQVTQEQYQTVMESNPSHYHGGTGREPASGEVQVKRPVEYVSWYDALVFCNKLSMMEGLDPVYSISNSTNPDGWGTTPTSSNATWDLAVMDKSKNGYRLPTEAEWEYACRAGTTTPWYTGNSEAGPPHLNTAAWYSNNAGSKTHEVGLKTANDYGLYDMHGNVYEWCWDRYGTYASGEQTDPTGAVTGTYRVARGGYWSNNAQGMRSACRDSDNPSNRNNVIGFRLVRSLQ